MKRLSNAEYRDKFDEFMNELNYIRRPGEKIKQCIGENEKYYCPYWFISNYGYIFSVAYNKLTILKPNLEWGGIKKNNLKYECPEYLKKTCADWEQQVNNGYSPQYYYYRNSYSVKKNKVIMHKIMEYYYPDSYIEMDENGNVISSTQVHHKRRKDWSKPPQIMNQANALQGLSEATHKDLTDKSRTIINEFDDNQKNIVKQGKFVGTVNQKDLLNWLSAQIEKQNPYERAMIFIVDEESQEVIEYKMLNCKDISINT